MPPDLDEFTGEIRRFVVTEHRDPGPARRGVDADDLIGAIQLVQRDVQDDRVDVESALAVERFVGTAETQVQIEDRLNIGVETVIALTSESEIPVDQFVDRRRGVLIEVDCGADPLLGGVLAVVALVVFGSCQTLVVRRHQERTTVDPHN